eukprot:m.410436 g.410436  ORF g.410436 m.410436 type:complete len:85 (+) comp20158_c7_seq8:1533-1787(+)
MYDVVPASRTPNSKTHTNTCNRNRRVRASSKANQGASQRPMASGRVCVLGAWVLCVLDTRQKPHNNPRFSPDQGSPDRLCYLSA